MKRDPDKYVVLEYKRHEDGRVYIVEKGTGREVAWQTSASVESDWENGGCARATVSFHIIPDKEP